MFLLLLAPWFYGCLTATPYTLGFNKLPDSFDGFKIAVIADLHSHRFGKGQKKLMDRIIEQRPDIVVLAGDIIDKGDKNILNVRELLDGISGVFPVYAIAGNHEMENSAQFSELLKAYSEFGVVFLDGQTVYLKRGDHQIALSGQKSVYGDRYWAGQSDRPPGMNDFTILLYHFGNEFDKVPDWYDLVISGHVHGGIIRIFNRGMVGYNDKQKRSFFPKYSKGVYRKESGSIMVLSAGLGDTIMPRINNRREIVVITLRVDK